MSGRGQRGVVYRATDSEHQRVALKRASLAWSDIDGDIRRAEIVAGADIPDAVAPVMWLRSGGSDWAAMAFVEGVHLGQIANEVPPAIAAAILASVLRTVRAVRGLDGLVFPLDLRPEHVRITPQGRVALMDLWQPRNAAEPAGPYDAPEFQRDRAGEGSEAYAAGALLYRMLAAADPEVAEAHVGRFTASQAMLVDGLSDRDVPPKLLEVLRQCWEFRPRSRSALAVLEAQVSAVAGDAAALKDWAGEAVQAASAQQQPDLDSRIGSRIGGTDAEEFLHSELMAPKATVSVVPVSETPVPAEGFEDDDGFDLMSGSPVHGADADASDGVDASVSDPAHGPSEAPSVAADPPDEEAAKAGIPPWAWGVGLGVLALLVAGVATQWGGSEGDDAQATPVAVERPAEVKPAAPETEAPAEPSEAIEPTEAAEGSDDAAEGPVNGSDDDLVASPEPAPAAPAPLPPPPPPPPPPPSSQVALAGDAEAVWLQAGELRYALPGPVPAGEYTIVATFGGSDVPVGSVKVEPGASIVVNCNALFQRCESS